jgi:hypothetical protein
LSEALRMFAQRMSILRVALMQDCHAISSSLLET